MGGEWSETTLGDLIDIKHGFAFKGQFIYDEPRGDLLLTPGNFAVRGGFKGDKFKYYDGPVSGEFVLRKGDLLITMTDLSKQSDTLGYPAFVPAYSDGRRCLHNQRLGKVTPKETADIDLRYIYYVMCGKEYRQEVLASATGTTVKHTSPERLRRFRFLIPPLPEQRAIAHILGTLDDKIELNRRMNETLEAMARALFKDWFVDFGPTRAKIEGRDPYLAPEIWDLFPDKLDEDGKPEGWEDGKVEDYLELAYGKSLPARSRRPGGVAVYGSGGITGFHDEAFIKGPAIIVGRKGTVGSLYWEDRPIFPIDTVFYVVPKRAALSFCYQLLLSQPLAHMNTDAAVPGLNRNNVYRLEFPWSGSRLTNTFESFASPLWKKRTANLREIDTLSHSRDLLLPKLMSGEIRVDDADKFAQEST